MNTGRLIETYVRIQDFSDVTLCSWVSGSMFNRVIMPSSSRVLGTPWLLKMKASWTFQMLGATHLVTQRHIQEDSNLLQCCC